MEVAFVKNPSRRYRALMRRADGIEVAFDGGAWNVVGGPARDVPHDIAHLVVEDELDLRLGVWGVLAAGGLFRHAEVVAGRQAAHAARRGREVIAAAGDRIMQAEMLTRAVCDAVADGRTDVAAIRRELGPRWATDALTRDALDRAGTRLRDAAQAWASLEPGQRLPASWPRPVAAELATVRRR